MLPAAGIDSMSSLVLENPLSVHPTSSQSNTDLAASVAAARRAPQSSSQPPSQPSINEDEAELTRRKMESLMWETRAWRGLNSAQWTIWGIVQAKIPGISDTDLQMTPKQNDGLDQNPEVHTEIDIDDSKCDKPSKKPGVDEEKDGDEYPEEEQEDGFDYLAYARDRAAFFWGDILSLGIMTPEELPKEVVQEAKILDY
jgi:choline kinase